MNAKLTFLLLLSLCFSQQAYAQSPTDNSATNWTNRIILDVHGSFLVLPFDPFFIPYNISGSIGYKVTPHWGISAGYSNFGYWASYSSISWGGYGVGIRYDRRPFLLKAELMQITRYDHSREWNGNELRSSLNWNPAIRLHTGFRVAPRFTMGLSFTYAPKLLTRGYAYVAEAGDYVPVRRQIQNGNISLFFGLSLPTIRKPKKHFRSWQTESRSQVVQPDS